MSYTIITRNTEAAQKHLLQVVEARSQSHVVLSAVHALAEAEIKDEYETVEANDPGYEHGDHWLDQRMAQGPEDTWSGRGNDLRRVRYEAVRQLFANRLMTRQAEAAMAAMPSPERPFRAQPKQA